MDAADNTMPGRYHRQMLLPRIGEEGQRRLGAARVLLVGCGALGSVLAEQLVRAGVGYLRVVDRDVVELTNLQRQVLFDEEDAREGRPKAVAAARRLGRINSDVRVEAVVADFTGANAEELCEMEGRPAALLLDGTDNVQTRYLINDVAVKYGVPWVYGACVGTEGRSAAIVPAESPCLRCLFPEPPATGDLATCDTAGVLSAASAVVASMQATAAIQLLTGSAVKQQMLAMDVWAGEFRAISTVGARSEDCPCCARRDFEFLERGGDALVTLCGRNAVQIAARRGERVDLDRLADRLSAATDVQRTAYLVRATLPEPGRPRLTVFADGRLLVEGTTEFERARSLAARYVG
jgi:adenylyltransferase/sulfurtransferase